MWHSRPRLCIREHSRGRRCHNETCDNLRGLQNAARTSTVETIVRPTWRTCLILTGVLVAPLAFSLGCDDERSVRTYQTAKENPPPASPFGSAQNAPTATADPAMSAPAPTWTLPPGWKVLPPPADGQARQMEVARIGVSADSPTAILTIVPLGGEGGGIMSNVARWERQLNLPVSTTPEQVEKLLIQLDTPAGPALVADLSSAPGTAAPQRIVAAIMPREHMAWFITLKGPVDAVGNQRQSFDQFVRSLHFADSAPPPPKLRRAARRHLLPPRRRLPPPPVVKPLLTKPPPIGNRCPRTTTCASSASRPGPR